VKRVLRVLLEVRVEREHDVRAGLLLLDGTAPDAFSRRVDHYSFLAGRTPQDAVVLVLEAELPDDVSGRVARRRPLEVIRPQLRIGYLVHVSKDLRGELPVGVRAQRQRVVADAPEAAEGLLLGYVTHVAVGDVERDGHGLERGERGVLEIGLQVPYGYVDQPGDLPKGPVTRVFVGEDRACDRDREALAVVD
jgi:hypothetical protein